MYIKKMKEFGIRKTKSFSDLLVVRVFDFFILGLIILIIIIGQKYFILDYSLFILLIFIIFILIIFSNKILIFLKTHFLDGNISNYFVKKLDEIVDSYLELSSKTKIKVILLTVFIWLMSYSPWIIILRTVLAMNLLDIATVVSITLITSFLPINPPAGVGVINGAWIAGLTIVGVDLNTAINFSLFTHLIYLFQISLFFLITILIKKRCIINVKK